jgi:hypothetical protein
MRTPSGTPAHFSTVSEAAFSGLYNGDQAKITAALARRTNSVETVRALIEDDNVQPLLELTGDDWSGWVEVSLEFQAAEQWRTQAWKQDNPAWVILEVPANKRDPQQRITPELKRHADALHPGTDAMSREPIFHRQHLYQALHRHRDAFPPPRQYTIPYRSGPRTQFVGVKAFEADTGRYGISAWNTTGTDHALNRKGQPNFTVSDVNMGPLTWAVVAYDHVVPWAGGGRTETSNIAPISKGENTMKANLDLTSLRVAAPALWHELN